MILKNPFTHDSRVIKESQSLYEHGYDVTVIALFSEGLKRVEYCNGVKVDRISLFLNNKVNKLLGFFSYFEFSIRTAWCVRSSNYIHCHDIATLLGGVVSKFFLNRKAKLVYDAHEYETEVEWIKGWEKLFNKKLEAFLIKFCDHVISVSPSIAKEYSRLYGIKEPSVLLNVPKYSNLVDSNDLFRRDFSIRKDQKIFLFQGGFTRKRGIDIILNVFSSFESDEFVVVFMGDGPLKREIEKAALNSRNIFTMDAVAPNELLDYSSSADYGILFYENSCLNHYFCSPNKLFEYLMAGLPVLASNLYEVSRFIKNNKVGVVAEDFSEKCFEDSINLMLRHNIKDTMLNIKKIRSIFCWENEEKKLINIYRNLL